MHHAILHLRNAAVYWRMRLATVEQVSSLLLFSDLADCLLIRTPVMRQMEENSPLSFSPAPKQSVGQEISESGRLPLSLR